MQTLEGSTLLITGIMASGKSTVAQHVAERLPKSVHLRGDLFRRLIVSGRVEPDPPLTDEAFAQLKLRYQLAAQVAHGYCEHGFTVVYQDIILGDVLNDVIKWHQQHPLYVVVLCPDPETVLQRDATRHKQAYGGWTPDALDHELRVNTPRLGLWLDNTAQTIPQTVDAIFAQLESARIVFDQGMTG